MTGNSKRAIASVAALQILVYHCLIPVFGYGTFWGSAERFLIAATYSGVDAFFFISAFSLVSRPVEDYPGFIKNRAVKLLPLFLIALLFGKFLWFIPSIMLMYLVLPPLYKLCRKKPVLSPILLTAGWAAAVWLILGVWRPSQDLGILLFRIPSMILGAYAVRFRQWTAGRERLRRSDCGRQTDRDEKLRRKERTDHNGQPGRRERTDRVRALIAGILLLTAGLILTYRFGYLNRLNVPFRGTFYLTGIPVMLGTVLLTDLIASDRKSRILDRFGGMTLELYFSQMVLGTLLVNRLFRLTGSRIVTNIATLTAVIAAAAVIRLAEDGIRERIVKLRQKA